MKHEYLYIMMNFLPEIALVGTALVVMGADLFLKPGSRRCGLTLLAAFGCLVAAGLAYWHWVQAPIELPLPVIGREAAPPVLAHPAYAVYTLFALDRFADAFKIIFALAGFLVLLTAMRYPVEKYRVEFAGLLLFAAVGLMVMANSRDLVVLFLGLETASLCLYALAAWHKGDARSAEAGAKYLLLGSLASAFFIYGASLLYVACGSTYLDSLGAILHAAPVPPLIWVGLLMLLVGFAFKVSAAPFHFWAPDVYQGAPVSLAAFLSTASKAAGFAVLIRVTVVQPGLRWAVLVAVLAALSLLVGNLVAIHQNNVKRLLAYSGIAQAGYLLIGVVALAADPAHGRGFLGITATLFYLFLYTVGNIGAFAVTGIIARETGSDDMPAFAGLRTRAPLLAFAMLLLLLSLGGIPLLAGFVGKWYLFTAGVQAGQVVLVLLAAVMSVVSIYYYLLIAKQMYILPADAQATPIRIGGFAGAGLFLITGLTVAIGVYPLPFLKLAEAAAYSLVLR